VRVKVKAWGDGRRRRLLKDAERKRKTERAAKRASKAPAAEGDHVYEIAKKQALYVARVVAPAHAKDAGVIGMSYRLDGTEAVCSTWADFRRFFKVIEDGPCAKCEKPVDVGQFCVAYLHNAAGRTFVRGALAEADSASEGHVLKGWIGRGKTVANGRSVRQTRRGRKVERLNDSK
jgi:hypothetical protein